MNTKSNSLITAFFMLIGLCGIIMAANFHYWESMTLPLFVSSLIFVLAGAQLVLELNKRQKSAVSTTNDTSDSVENRSRVQFSKAALISVWMASLILGTYLVGFYIAAAVFTLAYLKLHARKWKTTAIFAIVLVALVYLVFSVVLKTSLYKGLLFSIW